MIEILLKGFEFGIVLAFLIGPVFFAILQASLERGFWVGVLVAIGVSLSDLVYVVVCYLGFASLVNNPQMKSYMGYMGGAILIAFGLYHALIKSRRKIMSNPHMDPERHAVTYVAKGFLFNVMSPMVPVFWIAAVGIATIDFGYSSLSSFCLFFGAVLVTVLATDIGKAYLSGKLRRLITDRSLMIMNIIVGVVFLVFGVRLIHLAMLEP